MQVFSFEGLAENKAAYEEKKIDRSHERRCVPQGIRIDPVDRCPNRTAGSARFLGTLSRTEWVPQRRLRGPGQVEIRECGGAPGQYLFGFIRASPTAVQSHRIAY